MRSSVLFLWVSLAVVLAIVSIQAATNSVNPNVNLIQQGLIEKLCKNELRKNKIEGRSMKGVSRKSRGIKRYIPVDTSHPSCSKFQEYSFAQLMEENKKLLRVIGDRSPGRSFNRP